MKKILIAIVMVFIACMAMAGCDRTEPELSGVDKTVTVKCGTDFNIEDYLNGKVNIKDETDDGTKSYKLSDLEHSIKCDESIYDEKTGKINTDGFGEFDVELTVSDEAGNDATTSFQLVLDPIETQKGFYVFKNSYDSSYDLQGYCSFKNTSKQKLVINEIKFEYLDKDGTMIGDYELDKGAFCPSVLKSGETGFAYDALSNVASHITSSKDIDKIVVDYDYGEATEDDVDKTLRMSELKEINNYQYNVSHFAAETTLTNPYDKDVEYYAFLAGMFDKKGKLIGVMDGAMDAGTIKAKGKRKAIAAWLPDPSTRPDKTKTIKGAAEVLKFAGE